MTSWTEGILHWSAAMTLGGMITSLQYLYSCRLRSLQAHVHMLHAV